MKGKFVRAMAVALCCAMLAGCGKKEEGGRSYTMKNNAVYVIQNGDSYLLALEWGS